MTGSRSRTLLCDILLRGIGTGKLVQESLFQLYHGESLEFKSWQTYTLCGRFIARRDSLCTRDRLCTQHVRGNIDNVLISQQEIEPANRTESFGEESHRFDWLQYLSLATTELLQVLPFEPQHCILNLISCQALPVSYICVSDTQDSLYSVSKEHKESVIDVRGSSMATRCRVKSHNGCMRCRTRRKKCDETKPVCQACRRLGLFCSWRSLDKALPRDSAVQDETQTTQAPFRATPQQPSLRLPDFVSARRSVEDKTSAVEDLVHETNTLDSSLNDRDPCSLRGLVVQGVREGWHTILDHRTARYMMDMDRAMESFGHGQAARIGMLCLILTLHTVRVSFSSSKMY